jgi:hypothetical protein
MIPRANKVETVLDLLAEEISPLGAALRQLILKIINSFLRYAENTFRASLPRLKDTPGGVLRVTSPSDFHAAPSRDCIHQTSYHLCALLESVQARDPVRITIPLKPDVMAEIHQALRDLKLQESKTPAQILREQEALAHAELDAARKFLTSCRRERSDVVGLVNGYIKGKRIDDPKAKRQLMADAEAKVKGAEHQVELAESKFPLLWHDQDDDAQLEQFEQPTND